ncbi:hypothetical protein [Isoptericola rhizosphaerae]|uniref:hypothetical protein n=1 Tax=Isoptericola rhizosphaerae TaxID=3377837 RepID=UPI00383ABDA8
MHPRTEIRRSWRSLRMLLAALLVALVVGAGAPALADESGGVGAGIDDSKYTEDQKAKAEEQAATETAERTCDTIAKGPAASLKKKCVELMSSEFTRESVPKLGAVTLCAAFPATMTLLRAGCMAWAAVNMDKIKGWFWEAYEKALTGAEAVVATVKFIANAANPFETFVNTLAAGAVNFFETVMTEITTVTAFDASERWWRDAYAAAGVIGLTLLALGMLLTANHYNNGRIGGEEYSRAMSLYPLIAVVMIIFGPVVAYVLGGAANGLSAGVVSWMGQDAVDFLQKGAVFAGMSPVIPGGQIMGLVLFALLFMVMFGLLGTMIVQTVSTYMVGAAGGAAWGMSSHPVWRPKALMVPMFVVGLIFAKPVILFALACAVKLANSVGSGSDSGLDMLVDAVMMIVALGMVAFAPWTLLKWFPLLPDATDSARASGAGTGASAMAGVAGSAATQAAMMRARSTSGSTGGASQTSAPAQASQPPALTSPAAAPTGTATPVSAPAGAKAAAPSGAPAASGVAKSGAAAGKAGTAGTAGTTGAAGKVAAGSAGKTTAGTAGKTAAGAAGGAATGGALLAAQLAAQTAQAGIQKARESADAATPDVRS